MPNYQKFQKMLVELVSERVVLVSSSESTQFVNFCNSHCVFPCGGALTNDAKGKYFYIN